MSRPRSRSWQRAATPSRALDLADNVYSSADPRLVTINTIAGKGETPFALKFGQTFNDPQGPWLVMLYDALFGDAANIDADNDAINDSLQP